jgi:hypothetical protein
MRGLFNISRSRIFSTFLFLALSGHAIFAQDKRSPIGAWELAVARTDHSFKEKGTAFVTFNADHTLTGYGLTIYNLFTVSGTWTVDAKGKLTGTYAENVGLDTLNATFTGKATTGKRLEITAEGILGRFKYNGVPMRSLPEILGTWSSIVTRLDGTGRDFEIYEFTSVPQYPGIFSIAGNGVSGGLPYAIDGTGIITAKGKITAFRGNDFEGGGTTSDFLTGTFRERQQIISLLGTDASGLISTPVRVRITRP